MAGGALHDEDEDGGGMISDINVTPLVDITLVLLIIFMVTAKLIVNRAIPVQSPKAVSGEEVKTTLGLTIDSGRVLYLNGERMDDRKVVADYLKKAAEGNPEIQAVITADTVVSHGDVMEIIDVVKQAGVKNFALTVERKEK
ncbi:MAG: biopolymer transporter ExbD [Deltaproteobacteria bacterium]|nr:biopolymer transporter ExbD [Deltaproteobacteria bacterium]